MIKLASVTAVAFALTQSIQATPVVGAIGFTGRVSYDTTSAGTATEVTSWVKSTVNGTSGSFTSVANGTATTFSSSVWKFVTGTPITSFWSVGGYTFELLSSYIVYQGNGALVVDGTGIVSGNGYSDTTLSWSFTSQDPATTSSPDTWTISASANSLPASVPDGGATVILLGIAFAGVALLRRKLTA
jgi:hypothetical protein